MSNPSPALQSLLQLVAGALQAAGSEVPVLTALIPVQPAIAAKLENAALLEALDFASQVVQDVSEGKTVAQAFNDAAMKAAEKQAVALDDLLAP